MFGESNWELLHYWDVSTKAKPAVVLAAGILHFITITPMEIIKEGLYTKMGEVIIKQ